MKATRITLALTFVLGVVLGGVLGAALSIGLVLLRRTANPSDFWAARHIEARSDLFDRLEVPPGGIVLVGDSLTERGEWRELLDRSDVYNRGIAGDTATGVLARLSTVVRAKPRVVVLMIGTNDLEAGRFAADVANDIDAIVTHLRTKLPDVKIVLLSVLPMRDVGRGLSVPIERVEDLDQRIAALAKRHDAAFVDLREGLADPTSGQLAEGVTADGVHLNGAGYLLWSAALAKHLP